MEKLFLHYSKNTRFMGRLVCFLFVTVSTISAQAQDFEWWSRNVNWDGISPWNKYIIYNAANLGPNALPVPRLSNGRIDSLNSFSISTMYHHMKGDHTGNFALYGNYVIVNDRISLDAFWVPFEVFNVTHQLKEQRKVVHHAYYKTSAIGDVHINFNINLLNKIKDKVQLSLRTGYRYATSTRYEAARMTNAPGYYFDVSASRKFHPQSKWIYAAMAGMYVWQLPLGLQNDAFLFGAGIEYNNKQFQLQTNITGYLGYMKNGDQPIVYRLRAGRNKKGMNWFAQFQQGLHDFKYTTGEVGGKFVF
jgi:hypothetical protein